MRWFVAAGVSTIAAAAIVLGARSAAGPGSASTTDAAPGAAGPGAALSVAVQHGQSLRIIGPSGPIHVWRPAGYRAETAATVVYVHGYYTDADVAWRDHQLPEQFANSAVNAVFIVPEAPVGARQAIPYPDLGAVIRLVEDALGEPRPSGPLIVLGHSGAYRVLTAWIEYPMIDTVMLIDALYGELDEFRRWLDEGPARRLVTVGDDTVRWTEDYARSIAGTVEVDRVPPTMELWPPEARTARHLYVRSQLGHTAQVSADVVLPMLLRLEAVELLGDAPWAHPLGELPPLPPDAAPARRRRGDKAP